jgi:hypothetical protein
VAHYRRTRAAFAHLLLVGELVSGHGQAAPEQHRAPRREQSLRELHLPALRALVAPLRGCSRKRRQLAARTHRGCKALARKLRHLAEGQQSHTLLFVEVPLLAAVILLPAPMDL